MSWDRSWAFETKKLTKEDVKMAAEKVLREYDDINLEIEEEASDCITCFFSVMEQGNNEAAIIEISIYHMGGKRYILSLEADASDNAHQELAGDLAEDLSIVFDADPLEE